MIYKVSIWLHWLIHRPIALINLVGIVVIICGGIGLIVYQANRSIDVLTDWTISISNAHEYQTVDGKQYAVYHPTDSFVFKSQSKKLLDTPGTASRVIVCEATGTEPAREIQLDNLPAVRPAGDNPPRDNAITIPDVSKFAKLPRTCRLVIDVTYTNVEGTGRSHNEHAETEPFIVEEQKLDAKALNDEIDALKQQLLLLQSQAIVDSNNGSSTSPAAKTPATTTAPTPTPTPQPTAPITPTAPAPSFLDQIPVLGGLFKAIGL